MILEILSFDFRGQNVGASIKNLTLDMFIKCYPLLFFCSMDFLDKQEKNVFFPPREINAANTSSFGLDAQWNAASMQYYED